MNIGLTFDLRAEYLAAGYGEEETAEFDRGDTVDSLETSLRRLGHTTERIGTFPALVNRIAAGKRWDLVFNIAEGLHGIGREAQVPALLDAYEIAYTFSDPLVLCLTLHKGMTKRVIRDLGLATPDFAEVHALRDVERIDLPFPLFAKPVAEGTSKGVSPRSVIHSRDQLRETCAHLLKDHRQPVLVETFLPGREFTIGLLGTGDAARSVAAMEVILRPEAEAGIYSYANKENCEELVLYELAHDSTAKAASDLALAAWRGLGCRDAGRVDVRCDERGEPSFIEVNPLPGMHPEHSDLPILSTKAGVAYDDLMAAIVKSAATRIRLKTRPPLASVI